MRARAGEQAYITARAFARSLSRAFAASFASAAAVLNAPRCSVAAGSSTKSFCLLSTDSALPREQQLSGSEPVKIVTNIFTRNGISHLRSRAGFDEGRCNRTPLYYCFAKSCREAAACAARLFAASCLCHAAMLLCPSLLPP